MLQQILAKNDYEFYGALLLHLNKIYWPSYGPLKT